MLCLIGTSSLNSGASILLLKIVDTILQMGEGRDHWVPLLFITAVVIYLADT